MDIVKFKDRGRESYMVRMKPPEALALIASLALQMRNNSPNSDRHEFYTEKGEYFSIAVHENWPREGQ